MATINHYQPQTVSHPGETLAEKLKEMGMSIKEFAIRTSKPEKTIIAVIKGNSSITPDMSVAFENVTKIPARIWMNLQRKYDECEARNRKDEQLASFSEWSRSFPIPAMIKLGWIRSCKTIEEKTEALLSFFAVSSPKAWENYYCNQQLKVAFRISLATTKEPYAISAWLRKGELQASELEAENNFDEKILKDTLPDMKRLMIEQPNNVAKRLQDLCLHCGIKLIYTPCLPKAPISGSTRWINGFPCIQLSGRHNRYDIFWFSFFHEIGHILLHGRKDIFLEDIEYSDLQKEKEFEADTFAARWLLAPIDEEKIINNGDFSSSAIIQYAKEFDTHPSIIVGRLQHKHFIQYWQDNELLIKVDLF